MSDESSSRAVSYDVGTKAIVIDHLRVDDDLVTREARHWTAGTRGPLVDDSDVLARADLAPFVTQALKLGSMAIAATGAEQYRYGIEQLITDVVERTTESADRAADTTGRVVKDATDAITKVVEEARKTNSEEETKHRERLTESVSAAKDDLNREIKRLFGGDSPEVLDRLRPLLAKFESDLSSTVHKQTQDLLDKAAKQFDPSDPTSPMAKHAAKLTQEQQRLVETIGKHQARLEGKVDELATAVKLQSAESRTEAALAKVTPLKGGTYETQVNVVLAGIATGLGDEYTDTRNTAGVVARCKKGDGVPSVDGGAARMVLEMTDSPRTSWSEYLDIAERNREAVASLGLVREPEQNAGQTIRILGPRRVVMAFDPESDDAGLLRTAVILLRTAAIAASGRHGAHEVATAEEKIAEAIEQLARIGKIKKSAGAIQKQAHTIDRSCDDIDSGIRRLLLAALRALAGYEPNGGESVATDSGAA